MDFLVGLDVGTSLIKAAVYDTTGKQHSLASEKVAVVSPKSGYAEQDPLQVWQGTAQCIQRCLAEAKISGDDVQAVACAAQGDGVWAIDKNGNPAGNAILWCDNRASAIISEWEQSGLLREHYKKSGTVLWAGASAPILAWLKTQLPELHTSFDIIGTVTPDAARDMNYLSWD